MYLCKNNKTIILLASSGVPSLNRGSVPSRILVKINPVLAKPRTNTNTKRKQLHKDLGIVLGTLPVTEKFKGV